MANNDEKDSNAEQGGGNVLKMFSELSKPSLDTMTAEQKARFLDNFMNFGKTEPDEK